MQFAIIRERIKNREYPLHKFKYSTCLKHVYRRHSFDVVLPALARTVLSSSVAAISFDWMEKHSTIFLLVITLPAQPLSQYQSSVWWPLAYSHPCIHTRASFGWADENILIMRIHDLHFHFDMCHIFREFDSFMCRCMSLRLRVYMCTSHATYTHVAMRNTFLRLL